MGSRAQVAERRCSGAAGRSYTAPNRQGQLTLRHAAALARGQPLAAARQLLPLHLSMNLGGELAIQRLCSSGAEDALGDAVS